MIIGIDASRAFLVKRTGIEEYSYQSIKHLRNELAKEQVVLYVRKKQVIDFDIPEMWRVRALGWFRCWTQGRLALEMLFHPLDALFVPAHTVPWIHPKETIVTVHGLEYEFCPEAYSWWERIYMRWSIKNSCRWASKIVAVSENTKKDLISLYRVPEEKIEVIYEGVSCFKLRANNNQCESNSKINSKHQIPKPYFLFIGRIEARKNIARMIEAFDMFKKKCGTNHKLVLAGKPGYGYETVAHQVAHAKYRNDIVELGYVSEEEKWQLLRNADGFLFPSLYEGFGLPILEAQSVGVPVLTSSTSSLVEVSGGDGAVFVDPLDARDIARGIEKLALDRGFRSAIIESGSRNVARFSWEKCAGGIAEALTGK
ncbi:MAG: glycosyltransferase family 4 protein [Candidatus Moraniibacteriota bacterium]|nr:MAG: glycosyltransferase family 4 protein [Candidatus Moranbacteria bacterium]